MSEQNAQAEKLKKMTEQPVEALVCKMAVPSIIGMMVSALYSMADTFFTSKISTSAAAAIGIVFAYMAIIQAIGFFLGQGSGNYISRALGAKQVESAEKMASTAFFTSMIMSLVIAVPCFVFIKPLLGLFGATDTMMNDAVSYFVYILISTPFMLMSFVLNNQLRFQGNASLGMIGITVGAVLNVALDPIFIFVFKMGVSGASFATAISQSISFFVLLAMTNKSDGVRLKIKSFTPSMKLYGEIAAGGLPSLARQGLASIATICLNNAAKPYGDSATAAFSIVTRICFICIALILGFGQGFQPVCGFNYGAGLYDRVKRAFYFCIKVGTAALTLLGAVMFLYAEDVIKLFRAEDAQLVEIGAAALRYDSVVFPFMAMITISNMYLQNTRQTFSATLTSIARQGLIFIPVLVIMTNLFGLKGIQLSQAIADFLTFCLTVPLTVTALKNMGKQKSQTSRQ